jgi:hypothetical protein
MQQIVPLDPANYQRHPIHGANRTWAETNCYSDVVIELLNGLGHEPLAAMPFTLAIDFEGDQWTFFKFRPQDIRELYGLEIQELAPWRPLTAHIVNQVEQGRPVLVELDSFFLPDTAGTSYKLAHVKSTVAVNEIDVEARHLGYFHNQGYYHLDGQDFLDIFQVEGLVHERMLPPYIEFLKSVPGFVSLTPAKFTEASLAILESHLRSLPTVCPFVPFKETFLRDSEWLLKSEIEEFHAYSFANFRQYGACFELASTYLDWLEEVEISGTTEASKAFAQISQNTKTFQFQLARAMARRRPLDLAPLDEMANLWEQGMTSLISHFAVAR